MFEVIKTEGTARCPAHIFPSPGSAKIFSEKMKKALAIPDIMCYDIKVVKRQAPLAQLDRASGYGPEGQGFESLTACQKQQLSSLMKAAVSFLSLSYSL